MGCVNDDVTDHAFVVEFNEDDPLQEPMSDAQVWYRSVVKAQKSEADGGPEGSGVMTVGKKRKRKAHKSKSASAPKIVVGPNTDTGGKLTSWIIAVAKSIVPLW